MTKEYPFTWSKLPEENAAERRKRYTSSTTGMIDMVVSSPLDYMMPVRFIEDGMHKAIWNLDIRPDDVWLVTYPKSGTTLTQELIYQVIHGCQLDSGDSKRELNSRSPFIEFTALVSRNQNPSFKHHLFDWNSVKFAQSLASPRIIKTHLPISMLPPEAQQWSKIIHVTRNPKDVCVSFFYHEKLLPVHGMDESINFADYADLFRRGDLIFGSYWKHLKDSWTHRWRENVRTFRYEDMIQDKKATIVAISEFLGVHLPAEKIEALEEHLKFHNFKKNDAVNHKPSKDAGYSETAREAFNFIRKGIVGDWKNHFVPGEVLEKFEEWCRENNRDESGRTMFEDYSQEG